MWLLCLLPNLKSAFKFNMTKKFLGIHPESGSAFLMDSEQEIDSGLGTCYEIPEGRVITNQAEFEVLARELGIADPEEFTFSNI